jgi:hypothetical protein
MYLIKPPSRAQPIANNISPARIVQSVRFAIPYWVYTPYTIPMNAPVGPPMHTLVPPRNEIRNPATIAV